MADTPYSADDGNDLPRTVRQQQKEARARDQVARDILNAPKQPYARESQPIARAAAAPPPSSSQLAADYGRSQDYAPTARLAPGESPPATVTRMQLPFLHMMAFFLKAVLAAIPALLLLMGILWALGQVAQTYVPWLVKMRILVTFP
jgi:hypothetical protein